MLNQVNVVVTDMGRTLAFYRRLGLAIGADADAPHVSVALPGGISLEFDTADSVKLWDGGWNGSTGGSTVLGFTIPSREDVDTLYADLTSAGYRGRQRPYDVFWGGRYAIVEDPDGNGVGLIGPVEAERRFWPPTPPPTD